MKHTIPLTFSLLSSCVAVIGAVANPDATASRQSSSESTAAAEGLFRQTGSDPSFADALKKAGITPGETKNAKGGVFGSTIHVNLEPLRKQVGKIGPIPKEIGLHTEVCGDAIGRQNFPKWTRWYQEDNGVQVFRLFAGEQNVRGGEDEDGSPGRVEVHTGSIQLAPGTWAEWEGTYTIIKPLRGCIFQLMHSGSLWPMHIGMSADGEIFFMRRHPVPGTKRTVSLGKNMVGKSLSVKVRANGKDYEVYKKAPLDNGLWELVTKGSYKAAEGNKIQFRWRIYSGSRKGESIPQDGMLFVTGVSIR